MLRFLLDEQINPAVADGLMLQRPACTALSVVTWQARYYRTRSDAEILGAAFRNGLTLVTFDQGTIPDLLRDWAFMARSHAGVVLVSTKTLYFDDVGGLIHALAHLWDTRGQEDWTDVVDYLRRPR